MRGAGRNTMLWGAGDTLPSAPPSAGAPAAPAAAEAGGITASATGRRETQAMLCATSEPWGKTATVGDLRTMLAKSSGVPLDGKYRRRFDKALFKLLRPQSKKRRARCRFAIAEGGLRSEQETQV
jgi:hypothetical protein